MGSRTKQVAYLVIILFINFLFLSYFAILSEAQMPSYQRLDPITTNINAPTSVALDNSENVYVTESINNRLLIYSQSGAYIDTLIGLSRYS
jgi:hypothetical protein